MTTHFSNLIGAPIILPLVKGVVNSAANETFFVYKVPMSMTIRAVQMGLAKPERYTASTGTVQIVLRYGTLTDVDTAYTSLATYVLGTSGTTYLDMQILTTLTDGGFPTRPVSTTTISSGTLVKDQFLVVGIIGTPVNNGELFIDLVCTVDGIPN